MGLSSNIHTLTDKWRERSSTDHNIIHENKFRKQVRIGWKSIAVDGYCKETRTFYQFHGCNVHGHDCLKVRSCIRAYAGAGRRRVHPATVPFRLRLAIDRADARPVMPASDRTPPSPNMKRVGAPSAWTSHSDLDKRESDGRDTP